MALLLFGGLDSLTGRGDAPEDDEPDEDGADALFGGGEGLMGEEELLSDDTDDDLDEELSYTIDEVEQEVDTLQNRIQVVRGENEKVSERISTVNRNVDRLVDLYEIVTNGVNPFVGDQEIGDAFATASEGFAEQDDLEADIEDDIINAEAEDFLDDDIDDHEEGGDEFDEEEELSDEILGGPIDSDVGDPLDDDDFHDALEDEELDEPLIGADSDESLEAIVDDSTDVDDSADVDDSTDVDDPTDVDDSAEASDEAEPLDTLEETNLPVHEDAVTTDDSGAEPNSNTEARAWTTPSKVDSLEANGEFGDPPYLVEPPARNDVELTTLTWLEYLVDLAGVEGAAQTIAYYESIGWISPSVDRYLRSMVNGLRDPEAAESSTAEGTSGGDEVGSKPDSNSTDCDEDTPTNWLEADPEPRSVLTRSEHERSLRYIAWIAAPEQGPALHEAAPPTMGSSVE